MPQNWSNKRDSSLTSEPGSSAFPYTLHGVICSTYPDCLPDLLGYLSQITRASQRYRWPSWVIFDQNFRQQAADTGVTQLAHLDPTLFIQCFNGQAKEGRAWCSHCHSLDHLSEACMPSETPCSQTAKIFQQRTPTTLSDSISHIERNMQKL